MAKKADQCTDEYSVDDYGECWEYDLSKGHSGWHICQKIGTEAIWINGKLDGQKKVVADLQVTNPWCFEQCLGDAIGQAKQYVFSRTAYGFTDGVIYHTPSPKG